MDRRERARFEAEKRASTLQVLLKCARLANERAIARVNEQARSVVFRRALANLLPHISLEGTRLTDLASRVGVTKQAVSKLVGEFVDQGILELANDPEDGRAKLVRFTPRGMAAIKHGLSVLASVEDEIAAEIGKAKMRTLHDGLVAMLDALEKLDGVPSSSRDENAR
jgi:DNA-binding MarR family transcriptional regulator